MSVNERYFGKPFLRLVECYVLEAIGKLSTEDRVRLNDMAPQLRQVYGVDGSWDLIVASVMNFPASLPKQIEGIWIANREKSTSSGEELTPEDFVEMFVDKNFPMDAPAS
ncbi:MAG: hypothetical protein V4719_08625 [Planctomycetota bacterium]